MLFHKANVSFIVTNKLTNNIKATAITEVGVLVRGVCVMKAESTRITFYPYVMIISAIFLLITIGIYTFYSKVMDSNAARLRRHLAICMFFTFVIESARNLGAVTTNNNVGCRVIGEEDKKVIQANTIKMFVKNCSIPSSILHSRNIQLHDRDLCRHINCNNHPKVRPQPQVKLPYNNATIIPMLIDLQKTFLKW